MKKILEVKNICKTYQAKNGEIEALKNISFDIKEGEYISIIGPSGCGKSTLLSIISGLENKSSGEIYIDGKIGYMLQKDNLLEWRTIYKNVLLGLEIQKENTSENREYVEKLLKKYPQLVGKKIILYAPTFRGNIYKGFSMLPFDGIKLIESFDENTYLLYKMHPLLKEINLPQHPHILDVCKEDTHELFALSDSLISDYSSIVFDYSLLNKPLYFYTPDLNEYLNDVGCYVDKEELPVDVSLTMDELIKTMQVPYKGKLDVFKNKFFTYQDGKNTNRVVDLILEILKKPLY